MLVSSVITAAGRNFRMEKSQIQKGILLKNKLLLPFPSENSKKTVIETTINNVLSADVDECIVVLGHFADEIMDIIVDISDRRIKIVKNKNIDVGLSNSLLNGLNSCKNDHVLCVASDQPTVSTKTYNNIINTFLNLDSPKKTISILRRRNIGILNSAEGLGMPFIAEKNLLSDYLHSENDNLNPILRKIFDDNFCFYGVKEENDLELININDWNDYKFVLDNINDI